MSLPCLILDLVLSLGSYFYMCMPHASSWLDGRIVHVKLLFVCMLARDVFTPVLVIYESDSLLTYFSRLLHRCCLFILVGAALLYLEAQIHFSTFNAPGRVSVSPHLLEASSEDHWSSRYYFLYDLYFFPFPYAWEHALIRVGGGGHLHHARSVCIP